VHSRRQLSPLRSSSIHSRLDITGQLALNDLGMFNAKYGGQVKLIAKEDPAGSHAKQPFRLRGGSKDTTEVVAQEQLIVNENGPISSHLSKVNTNE
jgi:hypothetical protein